jgi:hypothetical protein
MESGHGDITKAREGATRFAWFRTVSGLFDNVAGLDRRQKKYLLLLMVAALVARVGVYIYCALPFEDSLISLRYARNIAQGLGFVYNANERVLGTTTPLWTLLNAAYLRLFGVGTLFLFQFLLNLALDLFCLLTLAAILCGAGFRYAVVWTSLLPVALFWPLVLNTSSGMEMSLFSALLLLSLRAFQCEKWELAFGLSGLLAICRPEGYLWAGLALLISALRAKRLPWRQGFIFLAVVLPWIVFSELYFGSFIPQSVVAKSLGTFGHIGQAVVERTPRIPRILLALVYTEPLPTLPLLNSTWLQRGLQACLLVCFGAGFVVSVRRRGAREMAFMTGLFVLFYSLAAGGAATWYGIPPSELFYPVAILGLWGIVSSAGALFWRGFNPTGPAWSTLSCILAAVLLVLLAERTLNKKVTNQYEVTTREVGLVLSRESPPDATLMLEPIGYIGFYSNRYVYDLTGLVSPSMVDLRKRYPEDWYFRAIVGYRPDYLVLRDFEVERNVCFIGSKLLFHSESDQILFHRLYAKKWVFPGLTVHGSRAPSLVVFEKVLPHS